MANYIYVGVTNTGAQVRGEVQAGSKEEVISLLRKKRLRPVSVKAKGANISLNISSIKLKDISRFTRQFSAMTSAGLPLVQCLDILASQTENKLLAQIIKQVSGDIQGGNTLADAMSKHPKAFNSLYCNMVASGEASGNLDSVLNRLADYQEKAEALRRKIKGAMTYPIIVLVVAVGATAAMLTWVVPTFAQMFVDMGGELPLPTQIVMSISEFLQSYIIFMILGIIGLVVGLMYYYKTEDGRLRIDAVKLKLPILGDLERKSAVGRFSQTLSTLLSSGVTIIDALSITAKTSGNRVLELGIKKTLERITGGHTIAEPLKETGVFPPMVIHMISVGEKTGDLSEMLMKVSQFYEEEVDAAVEALTSVIEPIMIVVMGAVIGGILVSMYLPMFDMIGVIG
ncbi:type II secretion system F family protein [Chitinispirillales bacterium ANBcel5]|uniref:type II secretion system F family protein n=1 Tax=Cellulosispirillum alkaliphilum TaxID=3039283 RepID=UPI002A5946C4|nr:type II secretion system F family protein [Chitinispirillales bacterium ANBcel5]